MLPREKGGVVDWKFKVYGTANIRVVDLSVLPVHTAVHPQATVFTLAEMGELFVTGFTWRVVSECSHSFGSDQRGIYTEVDSF